MQGLVYAITPCHDLNIACCTQEFVIYPTSTQESLLVRSFWSQEKVIHFIIFLLPPPCRSSVLEQSIACQTCQLRRLLSRSRLGIEPNRHSPDTKKIPLFAKPPTDMRVPLPAGYKMSQHLIKIIKHKLGDFPTTTHPVLDFEIHLSEGFYDAGIPPYINSSPLASSLLSPSSSPSRSSPTPPSPLWLLGLSTPLP